MWHLITRLINVDSNAFHSIKKGISDSITFKYDETKMDKMGEFVQEKTAILSLMSLFIVSSLLLAATSASMLSLSKTMRSSLLLLGQIIGMQPRPLHDMFMKWESAMPTQSKTMSNFLISTYMECVKGVAHMLPLPPHVLLFLHPLLAMGSGAWGRFLTSIFILLLG